MTTSILSFSLFFFALALLTSVLVGSVAVLAGNVFHAWGTNSTMEWLVEAGRRVFIGSLRRRVMRKVNSQSLVNVDGSRQAYPYLAVTVAPDDVAALTGPGCSTAGVASAAANGYARHAKAEGWSWETTPQVVVVADEALRRGNVRVRPVRREEFLELGREMTATHQEASAASVPPTATAMLVDDHVATQRVTDRDIVTAVAHTRADAMTMPAMSAPLVLTDARGAQHMISTPSVLIGRGRECGVRFDNADVSREHVDVYFQEGTWWLRDRGSRNGTTVDDREVKGAGPVHLSAGSQIVLGGSKAGESLTIASLMKL